VQAGQKSRPYCQVAGNREGSGLGSFNPDRGFLNGIVFRLRNHPPVDGFLTPCRSFLLECLHNGQPVIMRTMLPGFT
jgi:hypothetical protein